MAKIIFMLIKYFTFSVLPFLVIFFASPTNKGAGGGNVTDWLTSTIGCDPTQPGCDVINSSSCIGCDLLAKLFDVFRVAADYALDFLISSSMQLLAIGLVLWTIYYTFETILKVNETTPKQYLSKIIGRLWRAVLITILLGAFTNSTINFVKLAARGYIGPVMKMGSYVSQSILQLPEGMCDNYKSEGGGADDSVFSNEMKKDFLCYVSSTSLIMMGGMQGGGQLMSMGMSMMSITATLSGYWIFLAFFSLLLYIAFMMLDILISLLIPVIILPLLLVGWVFETALKKPVDWMKSFALNAVINAALYMVTLSIAFVVVYAVYMKVGDIYFPGPQDNYSYLFPDYFNKVDTRQASKAKQEYDKCVEIIKSSSLKGDTWSTNIDMSKLNKQTLDCYKKLPTPDTNWGLMMLLIIMALSKLTFEMFNFIKGKVKLNKEDLLINNLSNLGIDLFNKGLDKLKNGGNFIMDFIGGKLK